MRALHSDDSQHCFATACCGRRYRHVNAAQARARKEHHAGIREQYRTHQREHTDEHQAAVKRPAVRRVTQQTTKSSSEKASTENERYPDVHARIIERAQARSETLAIA